MAKLRRRARARRARRAPTIWTFSADSGPSRQVGQRTQLAPLLRHPANGELLDDLLVLDLHVEALLVPVDQLLHRRRQVAIGGDHRHELADVEAPRSAK